LLLLLAIIAWIPSFGFAQDGLGLHLGMTTRRGVPFTKTEKPAGLAGFFLSTLSLADWERFSANNRLHEY